MTVDKVIGHLSLVICHLTTMSQPTPTAETIEFHCTGCGRALKVPASAAGKRASCPQCNAIVQVPATSQPQAARHIRIPPADTRSQPGRWQRSRTTRPADPADLDHARAACGRPAASTAGSRRHSSACGPLPAPSDLQAAAAAAAAPGAALRPQIVTGAARRRPSSCSTGSPPRSPRSTSARTSWCSGRWSPCSPAATC